MTTPRPSLLDLHPVEALLALLLISAAALLRLVADPPQPMRRQSPSIAPRSQFADLLQAAGFKQVSTTISSSPMPPASFSVLLSDLVSDLAEKQIENTYGIGRHSVAELRTMARQQGLAQVGGRPIHKARKADLLTTLELCNG